MTQSSSLSLSRPIVADEVPHAGLTVRIATTEPERQALAAGNGLVALPALRAELHLRQEPRAGLHVTGHVEATVSQTCVVTLEPFDADLRETVDVHFLPPPGLEKWRAERAGVELKEDENAEDEPDPIDNGRIDLGMLVAEHLALGLDPYPRKPGAALDPVATAEEPRASPFAVLRDLGGKQP